MNSENLPGPEGQAHPRETNRAVNVDSPRRDVDGFTTRMGGRFNNVNTELAPGSKAGASSVFT
jgi:hypothetical protein